MLNTSALYSKLEDCLFETFLVIFLSSSGQLHVQPLISATTASFYVRSSVFIHLLVYLSKLLLAKWYK
jgi:hypothetical protein